MQIKLYTDNSGRTWNVLVPPDIDEELGIRLGPPDLSHLIEDEDQLNNLYKALAEAYLYNADQVNGNRKALKKVLDSMGLLPLLRQVMSVYAQQLAYHGEN